MSRPASVHSTPQFYRVSDRDLTEIELHSVDSINDLHRTQHEHGHKGRKLPRPPGHTPSPNGNPYLQGVAAASHRERPGSSKWPMSLQEALRPGWWQAHPAACAAAALLLLTLLLILCLLVQQSGALKMLAEVVREKQDISMEISQLIQELQALRHNLTVTRDRP